MWCQKAANKNKKSPIKRFSKHTRNHDGSSSSSFSVSILFSSIRTRTNTNDWIVVHYCWSRFRCLPLTVGRTAMRTVGTATAVAVVSFDVVDECVYDDVYVWFSLFTIRLCINCSIVAALILPRKFNSFCDANSNIYEQIYISFFFGSRFRFNHVSIPFHLRRRQWALSDFFDLSQTSNFNSQFSAIYMFTLSSFFFFKFLSQQQIYARIYRGQNKLKGKQLKLVLFYFVL